MLFYPFIQLVAARIRNGKRPGRWVLYVAPMLLIADIAVPILLWVHIQSVFSLLVWLLTALVVQMGV
jgi:hypothetical protein